MKKSDVTLSYHNGTRGEPMVNVKMYFNFDLEKVTREHTDTFSDPLFPAWLATQTHTDTMSAYECALEDGWMHLQEYAEDIFGASAKVYSAGRSGGWCVVHGLPDVEAWDAIALNRWTRFVNFAGRQVADIPYLMVWALYHHEFEQYRETLDACVAVHARDAGMVTP